MPISERSNARSRTSKMSSSSQSRMARSQNILMCASHSSLPYRTSTSLSGLPCATAPEFAVRRAKELESWKARARPSSLKESWSIQSHNQSLESKRASLRPRASDQQFSKPTKASILRSKTCPVPLALPDYKMLNQKQKQFDLRCKTMSASISSHALPNGETLHGFLTGARYNSGFTLDTHSLERYGVHIPKRNRGMLFVNSVRKERPSSKVFGCKPGIKDSHRMLEGFLDSHSREPHLEQEFSSGERHNDSNSSIERQLDEVFGPNEEGSSSNTTVVSVLEEPAMSDVKGDGSIDTLTTTPVSIYQDTSANLQSSEIDSSGIQVSHIKEPTFHSPALLSEVRNEENEQDFISHEAEELTREILKECQTSSSSFSSQSSAAQATIAYSHTNAQSIEKNVTDRSLQTSFESLSIGENAGKEAGEDTREAESKRPTSAGVFRDKPSVEVERRPKSAASLSRVKSAIFVDMSSLQSTNAEDS